MQQSEVLEDASGHVALPRRVRLLRHAAEVARVLRVRNLFAKTGSTCHSCGISSLKDMARYKEACSAAGQGPRGNLHVYYNGVNTYVHAAAQARVLSTHCMLGCV